MGERERARESAMERREKIAMCLVAEGRRVAS